MHTVIQGGSYRVHIQNRASDQWYEVQDLHVQETMPQLIGLSESYIMIYRLKDSDSSSSSSSSNSSSAAR
jgi:U4/U6.U5 tri-snRNP-associated protein 2